MLLRDGAISTYQRVIPDSDSRCYLLHRNVAPVAIAIAVRYPNEVKKDGSNADKLAVDRSIAARALMPLRS